MQVFKFLTAIILIIGLSACPSTDISQSKFVKQSEICQTYDLRVDETDNSLFANVYFRFGGTKGTTLVLNDSVGSLIKMGDKGLDIVQNHQGAHYTGSEEFTPGKKTFTFIDGDNKSYVNSISCERFKVYNMPNSINRNEVLELRFEGKNPESFEQLICKYKDTAMAFGAEYTIAQAKDNSIFIPLSVFKTMKNGPVTLQFFRRNNTATKAHGSIPGYLYYEYKGIEFKCNLIGKGNDFVKNEG